MLKKKITVYLNTSKCKAVCAEQTQFNNSLFIQSNVRAEQRHFMCEKTLMSLPRYLL